MDAPSDAFLWVKALHIIAVVCWFAALFYLPRLYVYHAMSEDAVSHQRFEVMERKLYRGIMWPSMIATLVTAHFLWIGVMPLAIIMKPYGFILKWL
jgi:putative membrane protein